MIELDEHISGFERLLRCVEGKSPITIKSYCTKVEEFFRWYRENVSDSVEMSSITRQDVESYLEYCYFQKNNNQTRLTKLIALRRFFRYLVYEEAITTDITAQIPRPKIRKGLVQKFTQEEILKLFAVMDPDTEKGMRDINILILGAFCGMRISEIIKLNLSDIIDDGKAIDINIIKTKLDSNRVIYLWKSPSMFIRQWLTTRMSQGAGKDAPFLVSYKKGDNALTSGLTPPGIDRLLKKYAATAGIRKQIVTMHMLRATHASGLRYIRGYDVFAIAERLGHKDIITTGRYIPVRDRISKEYPSLAVYWKEFNHLWRENIAENQDKD